MDSDNIRAFSRTLVQFISRSHSSTSLFYLGLVTASTFLGLFFYVASLECSFKTYLIIFGPVLMFTTYGLNLILKALIIYFLHGNLQNEYNYYIGHLEVPQDNQIGNFIEGMASTEHSYINRSDSRDISSSSSISSNTDLSIITAIISEEQPDVADETNLRPGSSISSNNPHSIVPEIVSEDQQVVASESNGSKGLGAQTLMRNLRPRK